MEEEKEKTTEGQKPAGEQSDKKPLGKKTPLIFIMGIIIILLSLALIITITPLKDVFFASKTSPELALGLVSGPVLEENGKYRFEVAAKVSGNPSPDVIFNRDDNLGKAGEHRVVIFLDSGESFVLVAAASNSQGRVESSLELIAGTETASNGEEEDAEEETEEEAEEEEEPEEEADAPQPPANRKPVITGITFPADPMFQNNSYSISAEASDPDGDSLTYRWEVSGPGFSTITATGNPISLRTPAHNCTITMKVTVRDGKGGEAVKSYQAKVNPIVWIGTMRSGSIPRNYAPGLVEVAYIGDDADYDIFRGFISFDISGLIGTVYKVVLSLTNPEVMGNPSFMHAAPTGKLRGLWIETVFWGNRGITHGDYNILGTPISSHTNYDITRTSVIGGITPKLAEELQRYLDEGRTEFQLRLRFENETSNRDSIMDGVLYQASNITLKVYMVD